MRSLSPGLIGDKMALRNAAARSMGVAVSSKFVERC